MPPPPRQPGESSADYLKRISGVVGGSSNAGVPGFGNVAGPVSPHLQDLTGGAQSGNDPALLNRIDDLPLPAGGGKEPPEFSASAIVSMLKMGQITEDDARARLSAAGWNPTDVNLLIAQAGPQTTIRNTTNNQVGNTAFNGVSNSVSQGQEYSFGQSVETGVNNITGTTRTYIDIPTPEEFLDDFRNGFAAHIANLGLGVNEKQWLVDNMEMFWGEYLGRLGQMAERGEQIFTTTPVTDREEVLGVRNGERSTSRSQGESNITSSGTRTSAGTRQSQGRSTQVGTEQNSSVGASSSSLGVGGGDGVGGGRSDITIGNENNNIVNNRVSMENETFLSNTQFQNEDFRKRDVTTNVDMKEELVARDKVGIVKTLSPLDFLGQQFPEASMRIIFQGQKGVRQANQRSAGGVATARRV